MGQGWGRGGAGVGQGWGRGGVGPASVLQPHEGTGESMPLGSEPLELPYTESRRTLPFAAAKSSADICATESRRSRKCLAFEFSSPTAGLVGRLAAPSRSDDATPLPPSTACALDLVHAAPMASLPHFCGRAQEPTDFPSQPNLTGTLTLAYIGKLPGPHQSAVTTST